MQRLILKNIVEVNEKLENISIENIKTQEPKINNPSFKSCIIEIQQSKTIRAIHEACAYEMEEHAIYLSNYKNIIADHFQGAGKKDKAFNYYLNAASEFVQRNLHNKAAKTYEKALEAFNFTGAIDEITIRQDIFYELSQIYTFLGDFKKAADLLAQIDVQFETNKRRLEILHDLGKVNFAAGMHKGAIELFERAILEAEKEDNKNSAGIFYLLIAHCLINLAKFEEANAIITRMEKEEIKETSSKTSLYYLKGLLDYYKTDFNSAKENFMLSLKLAENSNDESSVMRSANNIGLSFSAINEFSEALTWFDKALKLVENSGDILGSARILQNTANCHIQMGNLKESLNSYQKSLEIFRNLDMPSLAEILLYNISLVSFEIGDISRAKEFLQEANELGEARNNKTIMASSQMLNGEMSLYENNTKDALSAFQKSYDLFNELGIKLYASIALVNIAFIKFKLNHLEGIDDILLKALEESRKDIKVQAEVNCIACQIALGNKDLNKAKEYLDKLESLDIDRLNYQIQISIFELYSRFHLLNGNLEKANFYSDKLTTILNMINKNIPESLKSSFNSHLRVKQANETIDKINYKRHGHLDGFKLERIINTNLELMSENSLYQVLDSIIDNAILFSNAKRGFIILRKKEFENKIPKHVDLNDGNIVAAARNFEQKDIIASAKDISQTIYTKTFNEDKIIDIENALEAFAETKSIQKSKLKSVITFPIIDRGNIIGIVYLDDPINIGAFNDLDTRLISFLAKQASKVISNFLLISKLKDKNEEVLKLNKLLKERLIIKEETSDNLKKLLNAKDQIERLQYDNKNIITQDPKMFQIFEVIDKVKDADLTVLINGESGTGKELIARAIHYNSNKNKESFFSENVAVFSETLLESELFGHAKGSFTGAINDKKGIFEIAKDGTIFLDEIGEMSLNMQKKLLRTLEERKIKPVGSNKFIKINCRIICATHRDLEKLVEEGSFRHDLYYRINAVIIKIPPLRKRKMDIPLLTNYFLKKYSAQNPKKLDSKIVDLFVNYEWPGNIRELENEIKRLVVLADHDIIEASILKTDKRFSSLKAKEKTDKLSDIISAVEKKVIIEKLSEYNGNKKKTAEVLGIDRKTLLKKIEKFGI
ncbi:MAG: sigma 54-interacting transcriptional regulator [Pseudomonadota bacterium]